jgi:two-component system nitrate/nitrite sensor histidine kinase NarX
MPVFSSYAQVIQRDGLFEMLAQHIRQDNSLLNVEWRAVAFTYQGRACALALLRDVSKRILAEAQLQQRVGLRAHEQTTLLEISQTLASTLELQPGLILDQLRVLIQYTHACLFTLENATLVALAVRGAEKLENTVPFHIRLNGEQTLETLFNGRQAIRIADLWSNEPAAKFLRALLTNDSAILLEGAQSWLWVPLAVKQRIIGGIGIAHAERNYFTPHHADLALGVANQAAITLINAELYGHAQALAVMEERQSLARNLHDAINQSLFSAGLIAEVLPRLWDRDQQDARKALEDLRRLTRGAQAEMRVLMAELRPTILTETRLADLLTLLGNALLARTDLPVTVTVTGESSPPAEIQITFYRICQETLNNIAKHAKASHVEINLRQTEAETEMRVRDDGKGFHPEQIFAGHYGLSMMRERAEAVGALLTVTSQPGQGTELTLRWKNTPSKESR